MLGHTRAMTVVRRLARPLLSSSFVSCGIDALRQPAPKVPAAEPVAATVARKVPYLPQDTETLIKLNGAVQVAAGSMLALGRFPRLSAALLAGSLVPTTLAEHRYWEAVDETERARQQAFFFKDVSLLGGLILAAVDTEGRPGLAWRARHAGHHAAVSTGRARRSARREAKLAARTARLKLPG